MPILPNVDNETELLLWCKQTAASHQHLVGGNLIGKVVDPKDFQVYGVKNLHVVDASILPEQPSTHPQMTIMALGRYAADKLKTTSPSKRDLYLSSLIPFFLILADFAALVLVVRFVVAKRKFREFEGKHTLSWTALQYDRSFIAVRRILQRKNSQRSQRYCLANIIISDLECVLKPRGKLEPRTLLAKTSLIFPSQDITCLLGPSGAGKSTLMNAMCSRFNPVTVRVSGKMLIDGQPIDLSSRQKRTNVAYIQQSDNLIPTITPHEGMTFTSRIELGHLSASDREERVMYIVEQLGLSNCIDTPIGGWLPGGIEIKGIVTMVGWGLYLC